MNRYSIRIIGPRIDVVTLGCIIPARVFWSSSPAGGVEAYKFSEVYKFSAQLLAAAEKARKMTENFSKEKDLPIRWEKNGNEKHEFCVDNAAG
jgi:hypothetical protein